MNNKNFTRNIDIIFCLVLLPAMIMLLPLERWLENNSLFVALLLGWLYTVYFIQRKVVVPCFFSENKRPIVVILIVGVMVAVTYLLSQYRFDVGDDIHHKMRVARHIAMSRRAMAPPSNKMQLQAVMFLFVVVDTFGTVVTLLSELNKQNMRRQEVEFERNKAELSLYKAQINPHFLFNTLNALLGMVISKSEKTEDAFIQFTNLMRYMCDNSTKDYVSITTEIDYIEQYIELHKYRLNGNTKVEFNYSFDRSNYKIVPMLLITFVENAFKYGSSPHDESQIIVNVAVKDGVIKFATKNRIFRGADTKSSGIGIANCKKRLELLYPNRYTLLIDEYNGECNVMLTIKLE